jgi:hypothetical protein
MSAHPVFLVFVAASASSLCTAARINACSLDFLIVPAEVSVYMSCEDSQVCGNEAGPKCDRRIETGSSGMLCEDSSGEYECTRTKTGFESTDVSVLCLKQNSTLVVSGYFLHVSL